MALGANVKTLREKFGWSQEDLADAVGWTQPALQKLESRDSKKSDYAKKLADVFGISTDLLSSDEFDVPKSINPKNIKLYSLVMKLNRVDEQVGIDDDVIKLIESTVEIFTSTKNNEITVSDTKAVDGVLDKLEVHDG